MGEAEEWRRKRKDEVPIQPQKCSFQGTCAEEIEESATQPRSGSRQEYLCEDCGKFFTHRSKLNQHRRIHTGGKPYKCRDCGKSFTQRGTLLCHQKIHTKEKQFHCTTCRKHFYFRSHLIKHQRTHTWERLFASLHCEMTFQQSYHLYLWRHQFSIPNGAGTDKQKEEQCQPREEQRGMLQGPEEEPQSPTVDVEHDGQQQPDDTQGSHRPGEPQKSSFKGTCAEDPQEDKIEPPSSSGEECKCQDYGMVFNHGSNLTRQGFMESGTLLRHQRNHTGERPYKCPDCGKTFKDFSSLISLHRIHKGERPYKCLQCGECFSHSSSLSTHRRTHTGEKPSSCSDCGEPFTRKQTLILLQRIHLGEIESGTLLRHQRSHTRRNPFVCNNCGKWFMWLSHLISHQRIHMEERPYLCLHCGMAFQQSDQLRKHKETLPHGESSGGSVSPCFTSRSAIKWRGGGLGVGVD
uniref:C2H2-type domain-containing protein n=1 Tax=Bubo bubo TaxID=30461 RepID=A0A8C0EHV0_BUBBB